MKPVFRKDGRLKKEWVMRFCVFMILILGFLLFSRPVFESFDIDSPSTIAATTFVGEKVVSPSTTASPTVVSTEEKKKEEHQKDEKTPLYLITPTNRPSLLTRSIFHVLRLHQCFDVHWIVVHSARNKQISKAPLFRNVFPWITEIFTFNENSMVGNHERNVGIEKVLSLTDRGLVYFLDDDNILPADICQVQKGLTTEKMYYGDQHLCGELRLNMDWMQDSFNCTQGTCAPVDYVNQVDTGSFFIPVELLKENSSVQWTLDAYNGDGIFYTKFVNAVLTKDGNERRFERLPSSVKFHYNELNDATGCTQWRAPWSENQLIESLQLYRKLVDEMKVAQESFTKENRMDRTEVSFHNYVHILHVLRPLITKPNATYVEIGVWKGGTSILMSRHPLLTNIIGIDGFFFDRQLEEAQQFRQHLHGDGDIHWFKSDSREAIPELQKLLNGKEIDILFIDGDHSEFGTRKDFELYSPFVAEGGFVVFDDFLDTSFSAGVREAIMNLIRDGEISLDKYDVFGSVQNIMGAGPVFVDDPFFYDWQNVSSNEYVIRKRLSSVEK